MRSAKNFYPVTDYGAAKGILVAMAIGAIVSGEVILSLVDVRIGQASLVSQTLAAPAEAAPTIAMATRQLIPPASGREVSATPPGGARRAREK
jgi:hypothetical protein